jgi:cytochrome P450
MLRFAQKERPHELNLHDIETRLVLANLGSFHQTGIATTKLILNIVESNVEYNTIAILRDEISNVLLESGGVWSRAAVAKMVRADSVLRETLRINSFGARNMLRKVMVSSLHTEDGILLPKSCDVSMLTFSIQSDGDLFEDPLKSDPFRYSRMRKDFSSTTDDHGNQSNGPTTNLNFVSTGPQFLPFGHRKHACPGRHLVDFGLRMILAYVLLNYDLAFLEEYKGRRLEVTWMAEVLMPPSAAKIRVRRRED